MPADGGPGDALVDGRDESENQRLDLNWAEILQELRVSLTGSQVIGVSHLVVDFVVGRAAGVVAAAAVLGLWVLPLQLGRDRRAPPHG